MSRQQKDVVTIGQGPQSPPPTRQDSQCPPTTPHSSAGAPRMASCHIKNDSQGSTQCPAALLFGCVSLGELLTLSVVVLHWVKNVEEEEEED